MSVVSFFELPLTPSSDAPALLTPVAHGEPVRWGDSAVGGFPDLKRLSSAKPDLFAQARSRRVATGVETPKTLRVTLLRR
ncbi:hypothetical protein [Dendronalium sp. ChiSLP03b]|uniref:hypothetical protein n=1 Tax=Dendronalium sp. ChiSLP03b TaxID=3075381 RepID=UPI002AD22DF8|nr:hypothetical protein [Dendronalium sp. ChiSLP03b]MDZ8206991.1 hypothetical protein [Dendronalium sp. ChiSLP03b]